MASVFLKYLQISTPETALIRVEEDFIREHPELCVELGTSRVPVKPGWQFGTRYPGDPTQLAVGVPAEMHIYENGPHGVGLAQTDEALSSWPARLADWLRNRGLLNSAAK